MAISKEGVQARTSLNGEIPGDERMAIAHVTSALNVWKAGIKPSKPRTLTKNFEDPVAFAACQNFAGSLLDHGVSESGGAPSLR